MASREPSRERYGLQMNPSHLVNPHGPNSAR
jgi:hypothetical protein